MSEQSEFLSPLIPGFNPDPSVVKVGSDYYLITSTFEYLPGIPIYHSTDFRHWEQIGHVISHAAQLGHEEVGSGGGVWAPTIRFRDGVFYVIVTILGKGCMLYTATDPRGPWSHGQVIQGIHGIDPDLAWNEHGDALVTFGGWMVSGPDVGGPHQGILQAKVDLERCVALENPRHLWSGSEGMNYEEAPHLYRRGNYWYLMIAEGGTSRGHCVSIARSVSAEGPFVPFSDNPILSARSSARPIQSTGHGDMVEMPDGSTAMVLLGVRPYGSVPLVPLGRETFATSVTWEANWPVVAPVESTRPPDSNHYSTTFEGPLDDGWLAVRREAAEFTEVVGNELIITAGGSTLRDSRPAFVGRRQVDIAAVISAGLDASHGTGGLALRYDENHFLSIEANQTAEGNRICVRAALSEIEQTWDALIPSGEVILTLRSARPARDTSTSQKLSHLELTATAGNTETTVAVVDGRYFTAEVADTFFTGRVIGLFATSGRAAFSFFRYAGVEAT